jgi:uncharacterized protein YcbK (DUF882 family)
MIIIHHGKPDFEINDFFNTREFRCSCGQCKQSFVQQELVDRLLILRALLSQAVILTSGYRCQLHNRMISGAEYSQHCLGRAADILAPWPGYKHTKLFTLCKAVFPYHYIGKNFVHVDVRKKT